MGQVTRPGSALGSGRTEEFGGKKWGMGISGGAPLGGAQDCKSRGWHCSSQAECCTGFFVLNAIRCLGHENASYQDQDRPKDQDALKSLEAKRWAWEYMVVHLLAELKTANPVAGIVLPKKNAVLD